MQFDLHKEWCNEIFISDDLKIDLVFRATIKPAYQRRFPFTGSHFGSLLSFLFAMGVSKPNAKISSKQTLVSTRLCGGQGSLLPLQFHCRTLVFGSVRHLESKKTWSQIQEGINSMSFVPTATAVLNYWVRILAALEKKINRQSYRDLAQANPVLPHQGKTLYVRIPSAEFQDVCEKIRRPHPGGHRQPRPRHRHGDLHHAAAGPQRAPRARGRRLCPGPQPQLERARTPAAASAAPPALRRSSPASTGTPPRS